ncbi:MAG: 4Fe-4S binding protein [Bacteroidales bacterium]
MRREIINIDEEKCDGCGLCIPNCHEGALQLIDGKARLISDLMCDGLGACIGHCPKDAITIQEREAEPYDEEKVMEDMIPKGKSTIIAHLKHLKDYKEFGYMKQGMNYLKGKEKELDFDLNEVIEAVHSAGQEQETVTENHEDEEECGNGHARGGCPGSMSKSFDQVSEIQNTELTGVPSALKHWPVQMHLVNPSSPHYKGADLLLAADCVAYAMGNFHAKYLKGKALAIACPKLDSNKEVYVQKLIALMNETNINTLTVMKMEVPCCGGILQMAQMASEYAKRKVPVKEITVGIRGDVLSEYWI